MGWGRTLFLGDIGPCSRASQARITTGRRNRLDIEDTERDIHGLRSQLSFSYQSETQNKKPETRHRRRSKTVRWMVPQQGRGFE